MIINILICWHWYSVQPLFTNCAYRVTHSLMPLWWPNVLPPCYSFTKSCVLDQGVCTCFQICWLAKLLTISKCFSNVQVFPYSFLNKGFISIQANSLLYCRLYSYYRHQLSHASCFQTTTFWRVFGSKRLNTYTMTSLLNMTTCCNHQTTCSVTHCGFSTETGFHTLGWETLTYITHWMTTERPHRAINTQHVKQC